MFPKRSSLYQTSASRAHPCKIQRPRMPNHFMYNRIDRHQPGTAWFGSKYQLAPFFHVSATRVRRPPSNLDYYTISWSFCKSPQGKNYGCPYTGRGVHLPVDFFVLETQPVLNPKAQTPVILGRPFLATINVIINCRNESIRLTFGDITKEVNVFHLEK